MLFLQNSFKMVVASSLVLALFVRTVGAQVVPVGDFAYKSEILQSSESIGRVELTEEVYTHVAEPYLEDLRVFNADGDVVPSSVLQLSGEFQKNQTEITVPFFPLVDFSDESLVNQWIVERVADSEKTVYESRLKKLPTQNVMGFLLDVRHVTDPIQSLHFQWDNQLVNFTHQISIETSGDLESWTTVVPKATLAVFTHNNQSLRHDAVTLPEKKYEFLRVTVRDAITSEDLALMFKEIKAKTMQTTWQQGPVLKKTFAAKTVQEANLQELHFDLGGFFPIDSLDLISPDRSYFYTLQLYSSVDQKHWQREGVWPFYQIEAQGEMIKSPSQTGLKRQRFWKVVFEPGLGKQVDLKLQITYQPDTVMFVAQGQAPYHLAYGYKNLQTQNFAMQKLLQSTKMEIKNVPLSILAPLQKQRDTVLDAEQLQKDKLQIEKNKQSQVMWGVMIAGVGFLFFMAYRLFIDMKKTKP